MSQRLHSFCEKHNILDESQYVFINNRSMTSAVYKYIQKILDMSKAYDRISYKKL